GGKKGEGYAVKKSGDATVIMLGFPSVGKSTLLNVLTGAKSRVGAYAFTTLTVIPGLLEYEHAKIQVLDVPGVVHGAASGKGRGREVLAVMRTADLALIILDVNHPDHLAALQKEASDANLRFNARPPNVKITKKSRGGMDVAATVKLTKVNMETLKGILEEFRLVNCDVVIREDITAEQFIDAIEGNKHYLPAAVLLNKIDMVSAEKLTKLTKDLRPDLCISADQKVGIEELKELIFQKLDFIRIYTKEVGKKADLDVPMILQRGISVEGVCGKLHRDFVQKFRFARIWGKSAKFPGQKQMLDHTLEDGDILEIHLK
ncbi:MAG TPA: GTPase, partial [Candidatus Nanoarchaeia archaeon]|nr:GTPase [Candidatus Nanoarchaeia archaeon]